MPSPLSNTSRATLLVSCLPTPVWCKKALLAAAPITAGGLQAVITHATAADMAMSRVLGSKNAAVPGAITQKAVRPTGPKCLQNDPKLILKCPVGSVYKRGLFNA